MVTGTVKFVGPDGSWAFISRDDKQPKVFLHISEVRKAGHDSIDKGQRWAFELTPEDDGRFAARALEFLGYAA